MSRIVATTHDILERVLTMARLVPNVEKHLLDDQAEAVGKSSGNASGGRAKGKSDPTALQAIGRDDDDRVISVLRPFAAKERKLYAALRAINSALVEAERTCVQVLSSKVVDAGVDRCPGWNAELRGRLGGCGKPIEVWTDYRGVQHNRATLLCSSCRLAESRAKASTSVHDD